MYLGRASSGLLLAACGMILAASVHAAQHTEITWHGHSAFEIVTPTGSVVFIDPWLKNPTNTEGNHPVSKVDRADYILLTHGHRDHVGDAVALGQKTGAKLVTVMELGKALVRERGYPEDQAGMDTLMNIGGTITIAGGEITVHMVPAVHSSSLEITGQASSPPRRIYAGNPAGFLIDIHGGPTIYHSGDTAYFTDMALIPEQRRPDLALINIGGHFNMAPEAAVDAALALRPRWVVPHHYGTFPVNTEDDSRFEGLIGEIDGIGYRHMEPGDTLVFEGTALK